MKKETPDNVRSRDDHRLRRLVSDTRGWMKSEDLEERPLDWEAVAREEQALWWRERLRDALSELAARSRGIADRVAERIEQLAAVAGAEAALEVTVDAVRQLGRVLVEPAQACVRDAAGLEFTYAAAPLRSRLGLAADGEESVGIFISSTIPGARAIADAVHRRVTIELWKPSSPFVVVLVPEEPTDRKSVV